MYKRQELQDALAVVLKGIATRSTLPILSGIYLDAHNDNLTLQATDLLSLIHISVAIDALSRLQRQHKLVSEPHNLPMPS